MHFDMVFFLSRLSMQWESVANIAHTCSLQWKLASIDAPIAEKIHGLCSDVSHPSADKLNLMKRKEIDYALLVHGVFLEQMLSIQ
jgi:hypothetical protein